MGEEKKAEIVASESSAELEELKIKQVIIETQAETSKAWQKLTDKYFPDVLELIKEYTKVEHKTSVSNIRWSVGSVLLIFLTMSYLTIRGAISGDTMGFFAGTLVAYMLIKLLPALVEE